MTCEKCKGYTHPSRCPFCSEKVIVDDVTTHQLLQYLMKLERRIIDLERKLETSGVKVINPDDTWYWEHG